MTYRQKLIKAPVLGKGAQALGLIALPETRRQSLAGSRHSVIVAEPEDNLLRVGLVGFRLIVGVLKLSIKAIAKR